MSIFTEHLFYLTKISRNCDNMRLSDKEWIDLQRFEKKIIDSYNIGYYKHNEYRHLMNLYLFLKDRYKRCMKLEADVREISKGIAENPHQNLTQKTLILQAME